MRYRFIHHSVARLRDWQGKEGHISNICRERGGADANTKFIFLTSAASAKARGAGRRRRASPGAALARRVAHPLDVGRRRIADIVGELDDVPED